MTLRPDLENTAEYSKLANENKRYNGFTIIVIFSVFAIGGLISGIMSGSILVILAMILGFIIILPIFLLSNSNSKFSVGEFYFTDKLIFPGGDIELPDKCKVKDSNGTWYYVRNYCMWGQIPLNVPIIMLFKGKDIYDFFYYDPLYNNNNEKKNITFDGKTWYLMTRDECFKYMTSLEFSKYIDERYKYYKNNNLLK